ncbi:MAG: AraC family transcriptional regulator [Eubacteriales bacterium]|nr:AraC family transcriptional regulator [Eubacteriales bacterium]
MLNDAGILADSVRFYHEPDPFTAENLFHTPHVGVYHCNTQYHFERTKETCLNICQALLVDQGILTVQYRGQELQAYAGMLVLLDCREPHCYFAVSSEVRFRWFHIVGAKSKEYVNHIILQHGFVLHTAQNTDIESSCTQIVSDARQDASVHLVSLHVHQLLTQLASLAIETVKDELELAIEDSIRYIETHYADKNVKIPFLASRAALSTCYYLRKFKEYQSITPHQYLQSVRLRAAKEQLTTTSCSIEEIAETCGFCNTSHFVMSFRKNTGLTPLQFRMMWK